MIGDDALTLLRSGAEPAALVAAAEALYEHPRSHNASLALLRMSRHPSAFVRAAAASSLVTSTGAAPYLRLCWLADDDPSTLVRAAAKEALEAVHALPILCIQCSTSNATIGDDSGDMEAPLYPMFCDSACMQEFALDAARERLAGGMVHVCHGRMSVHAVPERAVRFRVRLAPAVEALLVAAERRSPTAPRRPVIEMAVRRYAKCPERLTAMRPARGATVQIEVDEAIPELLARCPGGDRDRHLHEALTRFFDRPAPKGST